MNENILEISGEGISLKLFKGFVIILKEGVEVARKPFDEFSSVIISSNSANVTTQVLNRLLEEKIPLLICNSKYEVRGVLSPTEGHSFWNERIELQLSQSVPFKKQVWQNIVEEKVKNQAKVLEEFRIKESEILFSLSKKILSGDATGIEGFAAKTYFKALFEEGFVRHQTPESTNSLLNYAYTILRSSVVRSVFLAGLLPAFGVFHKNKSNPFCLADDFIEPFRPIADFYVKKFEGQNLTPEIKRELVKVLSFQVQTEFGVSSVAQSILYLIQSYVKAMENKSIKFLSFPDIIF